MGTTSGQPTATQSLGSNTYHSIEGGRQARELKHVANLHMEKKTHKQENKKQENGYIYLFNMKFKPTILPPPTTSVSHSSTLTFCNFPVLNQNKYCVTRVLSYYKGFSLLTARRGKVISRKQSPLLHTHGTATGAAGGSEATPALQPLARLSLSLSLSLD